MNPPTLFQKMRANRRKLVDAMLYMELRKSPPGPVLARRGLVYRDGPFVPGAPAAAALAWLKTLEQK